jgi:hypothetical protein
MITDAQNRPTTVGQVLTGTGTVVSTDSIDLLTANRNIGRSFAQRMFASITSVASLAGGTSIQAQLITSASGNLSSPTVLASGPVVTLANAIAGAKLLDVPIPGTAQRYLGLQFVLTGTFTGSATVQGDVVAETDNQPYVAMNTGL